MVQVTRKALDKSKSIVYAGIMGSELVGPLRVPKGVKMTSINYVDVDWPG